MGCGLGGVSFFFVLFSFWYWMKTMDCWKEGTDRAVISRYHCCADDDDDDDDDENNIIKGLV